MQIQKAKDGITVIFKVMDNKILISLNLIIFKQNNYSETMIICKDKIKGFIILLCEKLNFSLDF